MCLQRIIQQTASKPTERRQQTDRTPPHIIKENKGEEKKEGRINNIYSSELKSSEPPVITLALNDKSEYPVYNTNIIEWRELYPSVNVMQELRKMKGWLIANPQKRKTKRGIAKFINSWLSREQDAGKSKEYSNKKEQSSGNPFLSMIKENSMEVLENDERGNFENINSVEIGISDIL